MSGSVIFLKPKFNFEVRGRESKNVEAQTLNIGLIIDGTC